MSLSQHRCAMLGIPDSRPGLGATDIQARVPEQRGTRNRGEPEQKEPGTEENPEQRGIRNRGVSGTEGYLEQRSTWNRGESEQRGTRNRGVPGTEGYAEQRSTRNRGESEQRGTRNRGEPEQRDIRNRGVSGTEKEPEQTRTGTGENRNRREPEQRVPGTEEYPEQRRTVTEGYPEQRSTWWLLNGGPDEGRRLPQLCGNLRPRLPRFCSELWLSVSRLPSSGVWTSGSGGSGSSERIRLQPGAARRLPGGQQPRTRRRSLRPCQPGLRSGELHKRRQPTAGLRLWPRHR
ncbi:RNA-binding protein Musashi homolog 2 isoform X6 [Tamandua tetradactyla]